jgi:glycosyltransferase involved in cell wall biosynthesis
MVIPAVSVLVPVYNRAELLRPCIESALAQTFGDIEVVVVDGASTDGTWDVCREYAAADPRVRAIREETNSGPVRGWARSLEAAAGRYATFLWSDDVLLPSFLERTVPFLDDEEMAFAYTAAEIGANPGSGVVRYCLPSTRIIESERFVVGALSTRRRFPVSPACALFRLADLRQDIAMELPLSPIVDLSATGAGTDLLFYLRSAARRPLVAHVAEPLAFFRAHPGSISSQGRSGAVALQYALTRSWFAREYGRSDLIPTILAWHWLGQMRAEGRPVSAASAVRRYHGLTDTTTLMVASTKLLGRLALTSLPWVGDGHGAPPAVATS